MLEAPFFFISQPPTEPQCALHGKGHFSMLALESDACVALEDCNMLAEGECLTCG